MCHQPRSETHEKLLKWSGEIPSARLQREDGFGEKIRTTVKDSEELPKLSAASRTVSPDLMLQKESLVRSKHAGHFTNRELF